MSFLEVYSYKIGCREKLLGVNTFEIISKSSTKSFSSQQKSKFIICEVFTPSKTIIYAKRIFFKFSPESLRRLSGESPERIWWNFFVSPIYQNDAYSQVKSVETYEQNCCDQLEKDFLYHTYLLWLLFDITYFFEILSGENLDVMAFFGE